MYSISPGLYTCTVYHLVYIHVQYITWFIYMYSISPGLYTCTVYHMYSISPGLHTMHDITKTFGTWKLVYTNYILQYAILYI